MYFDPRMGAKFCARSMLKSTVNFELCTLPLFEKIGAGNSETSPLHSHPSPIVNFVFRMDAMFRARFVLKSAAKLTFSPQPLLEWIESNLGNQPQFWVCKRMGRFVFGRKILYSLGAKNAVYFGRCAPPLFEKMVRWELRAHPQTPCQCVSR